MGKRLRSLVARTRLGRGFWITFLLACLVAEGGEFLLHKLTESDTAHGGFTDTLVTATGLYQMLVTAPRRPVVRVTSIIEIDPAHEFPSVSANNVCTERAFVAALLRRIDAADPSVIVLDKYFGRDTCRDDPAGTVALREAIADVRTRRPVVVGLRARPAAPSGEGPHVLEPSVTFGRRDAPATNEDTQQGIVNIAVDNRRLALVWHVYRSLDEVGTRTFPQPTLALTAASLHAPKLLLADERLQSILQHDAQPYIGFMAPEAFSDVHHYAGAFLCGRTVTAADDWQACARADVRPPRLGGRIVLVAERDDRDVHRSILGRIAGFYLQANYIEALLDDRYYTAGGPVFDYGLGFLFLLGLQLVLVTQHGRLLRTVGLITGLIVALVLLLYLLVVHASVYVDPVPVTASAVMLKLLHTAYEAAHERARPPRPRGGRSRSRQEG